MISDSVVPQCVLTFIYFKHALCFILAYNCGWTVRINEYISFSSMPELHCGTQACLCTFSAAIRFPVPTVFPRPTHKRLSTGVKASNYNVIDLQWPNGAGRGRRRLALLFHSIDLPLTS